MRSKIVQIVFILSLLLSLQSCEVVEGIFKAGVGVGVFIVVAIVAVIIFIINRVVKKE